MIVKVEVPDQFAKEFHLDEPPRSRELLETFVLQRHAEGALSAGQVAQVLGLSFQETETLLRDHSAAGLGPDGHAQGLQNLERLRSR